MNLATTRKATKLSVYTSSDPELYPKTYVYLEPVINQRSVPVFILVSRSSVVFAEAFLISFLLNQIYKIFLFLSLDVSVVFQCWQVCRYLEVLGTFIKETQRSHYI